MWYVIGHENPLRKTDVIIIKAKPWKGLARLKANQWKHSACRRITGWEGTGNKRARRGWAREPWHGHACLQGLTSLLPELRLPG